VELFFDRQGCFIRLIPVTDIGGKVSFFKFNGVSKYTGSKQDGLLSKSYGRWNSSFSFKGDITEHQSLKSRYCKKCCKLAGQCSD